MKFQFDQGTFDEYSLRLVIGAIALGLPSLVIHLSENPLPSISASYYTSSRDVFVGCLFAIGALLIGYNGRTIAQFLAAKVAAIASILIHVPGPGPIGAVSG